MAEGIMAEERLLHPNIDKIKEHYGIKDQYENEGNVDRTYDKSK